MCLMLDCADQLSIVNILGIFIAVVGSIGLVFGLFTVPKNDRHKINLFGSVISCILFVVGLFLANI